MFVNQTLRAHEKAEGSGEYGGPQCHPAREYYSENPGYFPRVRVASARIRFRDLASGYTLYQLSELHDMKRLSTTVSEPSSSKNPRFTENQLETEKYVSILQTLRKEELISKFSEVIPTLKDIISGKVGS